MKIMTQAQVDLKRKRECRHDEKEANSSEKANARRSAVVAATTTTTRDSDGDSDRDSSSSSSNGDTDDNDIDDNGTDKWSSRRPDISKALLDFDDYVQRVTTLENSFRADDDIRTRPEYHLRMFDGDSTDPNAMATKELPKIPTTKERVPGILTNPIRQVKKAIDRREIFMIAYICTKDLNQRVALDTLHLSARTRKLVQLLWLTLPASYTNYIHHESIITQFSHGVARARESISLSKTISM